MRDITLFDGPEHLSMLPLTYLRPVSHCRVGMMTILEKWQLRLSANYSCQTSAYLQDLFPLTSATSDRIWINGAVLPSDLLQTQISSLKIGELLISEKKIVALRSDKENINIANIDIKEGWSASEVEVDFLEYPEDILNYCDQEFRKDYKLVTDQAQGVDADPSVRCRGSQIFIDPTAKVYDCILNATEGPIYIGPNAEVMEQAVIKGPVCIGANSTIHVGAKVYAHTMLGPHCKIGGEVKRATMFGYANKAHDGYLGDAVLSHWCNLGADTNNSNMKNTYGHVSLWSPAAEAFRMTDRQFLGVIMGDHTMSAINTAYMTGSVTGVCANVFGNTNPKRWSPCFTWGDENTSYDIDKAIEVAQRAMSRRNIELSPAYAKVLRHISAGGC